jgi:transcriptional regulator GlxA family with amidase domain
LESFGVEVIPDQPIVAHGNIATAAGCLAAIDLTGWAIEKLCGKEIKKRIIDSVLPNGNTGMLSFTIQNNTGHFNGGR